MKKLLTLLLALTLVFIMAVPVFAEPENFLTNPQWTKGTAGSVTYSDGVAKATGFAAKYSAPDIDILPAIKAALDGNDEVEIAIIFDARVNFKAGATEKSTNAQMLLRGTSGIAGVSPKEDPDTWYEEYDEALDGEDRVFSLSNGNILKYLSDPITITDEWTTFSQVQTFYAAQVDNTCVIKWRFTLDRFTTFDQFDSLEIRNFQVVLAEDAEDLLPEKDEDEVEDEKVEAPTENKPVATQKPQVQIPAADETPAPAVTPAPDTDAQVNPDQNPTTTAPADQNNETPATATVDTTTILVVSICCSTIIIVACIVAVVVVKKKTSN